MIASKFQVTCAFRIATFFFFSVKSTRKLAEVKEKEKLVDANVNTAFKSSQKCEIYGVPFCQKLLILC